MIQIPELWYSRDPEAWERALDRYWEFVKPASLDLERELESLDLERVRRLDATGWYEFLRDKYFKWKYTAGNRYATTTRSLRRYADDGALGELHRIKERLLSLDRSDVASALATACEIRGLGPPGASGLLALMYPDAFGTIDQFVVKALLEVPGLPESRQVARMKPEDLSTSDGVLLVGVMRRKAAENNAVFATDAWTPRKVDKVLWTYGHDPPRQGVPSPPSPR